VPRTTVRSRDDQQSVPSTWLSVLAGLTLGLALFLGYIGGAVLDPQHFAHRASTSLDDSAVRGEVSSAVSSAISSAGGSAVPSAQVSQAVDGVIGEPRFGREFRAAIVKVHTALVEQGKSSATLDLSSIGPLVAKRLQGANPGMAVPASVPPVSLEINPPSAVSNVVQVLHSLSWLPGALGLIALALFAALLVRAGDRLAALRRAAITTLITGIVLLAVYFIAREVAVSSTSNSGAAGGIAGAYFGDFAIASLILAGAGVLGWFGARRSAAADAAPRRVERAAPPAERPSEASTRVLGAPRPPSRVQRDVPTRAPSEPQAARVDLPTLSEEPTKTCPDCAETVLVAARVCKHCGYRFAPSP
jgi:hypothetical protein